MTNINILNSKSSILSNSLQIYRPIFFKPSDDEDYFKLKSLITENPDILIYDTIAEQLAELIKINHPDRRLLTQEYDDLIAQHTDRDLERYGVWVYYPWIKKLVHLLNEEEFVRVRTSRNVYKITLEEIETLKSKKIGVIGLSVGQSIAMTLAMERTCGEIRLADFDVIELSNMNRIKVNVHDLGRNKAITAARQIAELDPFINVVCYTDGITKNNINDFFSKDGKLDILVEECDGIDIKILSRLKAKELCIPVVMDTNDKGMLDVERFDLEPNRPIFHGKVADLECLSKEEIEIKLTNLSIAEKIGYLGSIIGMENLSDAMKISVAEMNKSIVGWPQIASAVTLGGAMITDVCRKILLNHFRDSGRYFIDFDQLLSEDFNTIKY